MTIAMLSMDVFLLIWMPSAYMVTTLTVLVILLTILVAQRLPPDLQKHVALKISSVKYTTEAWQMSHEFVLAALPLPQVLSA